MHRGGRRFDPDTLHNFNTDPQQCGFFYAVDYAFSNPPIANSEFIYYIRAILNFYKRQMKGQRYLYFFLTSIIILFACKKHIDNNIIIDSRDNVVGSYRYTGSVIDTSIREATTFPYMLSTYYYGSHNVNGTVKIEKSNLNDSILYLRRVIRDNYGIGSYETVLFETDPGYAFYQRDWSGQRFSDSFVTAKLNGSMLTIPRQIAPLLGGGISGGPIYIEGTASISNNQIILNYSTKHVFGNHWYTITAIK